MSETGKGLSGFGGKIVTNLTAMGIFGVLSTSFVVSFASLVFSSSCPEYLAASVALFLLAGCVLSIIIASLSSYSGVIAMIQDVPVAVSGLIALSLAGMLTDTDPQTLFANIFAAIALSTLLTGACFLLLGTFKLGNLVRFIPYPVMGGFLAATGWLLFKGGLQVSTGIGFELLHPVAFFQRIDYPQLACAVVFGVGLLVLTRRFPASMLVAPGTILGSLVLFLLAAGLLGYSTEDLGNHGWLLGPLPDQPLWRSVAFPDFSLIDGSLVFRNIGSIGTLVVLSVIAFLLNSSGVEFIAGRDLEINRDLKATGVANLVSGIAGAPAGYVFISDTALATRMNARDRSVGILHGVFLLIVFFVGGAFLSFFPRFIAGGLPLYIGLSMLSEWLFDVRRSVPKVDHLIILTILLVVEFWGFLQGIGIGIGASVVIFVFRYSSIDLVKNVLDGSSVRSSKDRPITDQRLLDYNTDRILILSLQGFVFFGTANSLYEKVKRLTAASDKHIGFVLMDMGLVQGIDSSAVKSFEKLVRHLEEREIELLLVALPKKVRLPFEAAGFTGGEHGRVHYFVSLDHATEWCEDIIIKNECAKLMEEKEAGRKTGGDLFQAVYEDMMAALENQVLFESLMDRMTPYLERLEAVPGDILFRQKELCPDVYFILRGQVTLSRTNRSGERIRIRTLGPWTITGELGAFLGYRSPYEAEVVKEGVVFRLEAGRRKQMADEDPGLASDFQQLAIIMLGNQLMKTSRTIGERIQ